LDKNVLGNAGSDVTGALDKLSAILDSAGSGGASASAVAVRALAFGETGAVLEDAIADAVRAGAAESEAEDGVEAEAGGNPRPNANNMAAMASLTSLPLT
jgi:hypothetical protein